MAREEVAKMIRKLRVLGLALVAVLAMGAMAASAASADQFHSEGEPTTITAEQEGKNNNKLEVPLGAVSCETVRYAATTSTKTVSSLSVTPTYIGCLFAGFTAIVETHGCTYTLPVNAAVGNTTGAPAVVCPENKPPIKEKNRHHGNQRRPG
jgi:hypothetical protein